MYCTHYIPSVLICICTINKDYYYSIVVHNDYSTKLWIISKRYSTSYKQLSIITNFKV